MSDHAPTAFRLRLPGDDRALSPYTGFTRAHFEAVADGLLDAAQRFASPRGGLIDLPGPPSVSGVRSDGLEGYARTFLAAAFRVAGAQGADPRGRLERYAEGLAAGTRTPGRDDAESWPPILDHPAAGQPMVESASVALGLRLTRPWLWDRLPDDVRERAEAWLRGALRHAPAPNNWYLFPLSVAGFLESVGRGDAETRRAIERAQGLLEDWYRGDGWYADGEAPSFDHYNGWALHLYPLLHAHLCGDAERAARYGARLREHLACHGLLFGADGAPVYFGRSLTYRFAAAAAPALGALTGHTPYPPGTTRRLLSGALRYFLDRGALSDEGVPTLGWHGPHPPTVQRYSGPASPYWAVKGLLALLVPADAPLWTVREEPAPSEVGDRALAVPSAGLLVQSTAADGLVRLHNHGSHRLRPEEPERAEDEDPLYARLAYSTGTGPTAAGNEPDNHFALELPAPDGALTGPAAGGGPRSARRRVHPLGTGHVPDGSWAWAASWHRPAFPAGAPVVPGLRVESLTFVHGRHELRVHRVRGAPPGTRARLTGWAVEADGGGRADGPASALHGLYGWDGDRPRLVRAPAGTAFARWARLPLLTGPAEGGALFAALAVLTRAGPSPGAAESARVRDAGPDAVEVHIPADGPTCLRVRVSFAPLTVRVASA